MKKMFGVGMAMALAAVPVFGQSGYSKPPDQQRAPEAPKIITRTNPHDWTLTSSVALRVYTETDVKTNMPRKESFDFTSAAIVFPMIGETASSVPKPMGTADKIDGKLKLNGQVSLTSPTEVLTDYPCGTKLAKWAMLKWQGEALEIQMKTMVTSFQVKFDEALANKIKWPDAWPASVASALEPEYFIDQGFDGPYDMTPVKELMKTWMGGKDPKKAMGPTQLAKFFAGQVLQYVQVSGNGLLTNHIGEVEGVNVQGPLKTIETKRGSEFDMVSLLVAMYRQAGLPSRTVIGWDVGNNADKKFLSKRGAAGLRVWAEFALVDPAQPDPIWVPVDIVRMKKSSSRPQALDKDWPFFGDNKEMDGVVPFAFQVFPPAKGVMSYGAPAFFGWLVTPKPPDRVIQTLRFDAMTTSKRTEDQKKDDPKNDKRKKNPYSR